MPPSHPTERTPSTSRRTQFSSCDACRQARVACDASKKGYQPGRMQWNGTCSRCSVRKRTCTFEWIKGIKEDASQGHQFPITTAGSFIQWEPPGQINSMNGYESSTEMAHTLKSPPVPLEGESTSTESLPLDFEVAENLLSYWSDQIFHSGFGAILGLWIGRHGCPLVNNPTSETSIHPTKLFSDLDALMDEQLRESRPTIKQDKSERDYEIDQSLCLAIKSYTTRWLPNFAPNSLNTNTLRELSAKYWRDSRKAMLKVINRVSYRSVLTLYLFSQTPIPVGISDEEELEGLTGLVCTQVALLQIQQLRGRLRSCQFSGSEISSWSDKEAIGYAPNSQLALIYVDLENRAYWAALMWDTSNSVTLNFNSTLSTGLKGACLEPAWVLTRGFLVESFCPKTEKWREKGVEVDNDMAAQMISAAGICRLYVWRTIASVKEALREGVDEDSVVFAWRALCDGLSIFNTIIRPSLQPLGQKFHLLSQINRLSWYETLLHYDLGILILVDAIEVAHRVDLRSQISDICVEAEKEYLDLLNVGLKNTYSVYSKPSGSEKGSISVINTSLVAIDPYPHYVVASIQLARRNITKKYHQNEITHNEYTQLSSILIQALDELPQNSKSVCFARGKLDLSTQP